MVYFEKKFLLLLLCGGVFLNSSFTSFRNTDLLSFEAVKIRLFKEGGETGWIEAEGVSYDPEYCNGLIGYNRSKSNTHTILIKTKTESSR